MLEIQNGPGIGFKQEKLYHEIPEESWRLARHNAELYKTKFSGATISSCCGARYCEDETQMNANNIGLMFAVNPSTVDLLDGSGFEYDTLLLGNDRLVIKKKTK